MRVSFVRDKIDYIPEHDSLLWIFISLTIMHDKMIEEAKDQIMFMSSIIAGGPYDSGYYQDTVSKFIDEYDKIRLMFKKEKKKEVDVKELDDLLDLI